MYPSRPTFALAFLAAIPVLSSALLAVAGSVDRDAAALSSARSTKPWRPCGPGTFRAGYGRCEPCPPGHYNWLPNARSCQPCPANTYTPFRGVVDESLCLACAVDSYSAAGSSSCTRCSKGYVRSTPTPSSSGGHYYRYRYNRPQPGPVCSRCTSRTCSCAWTAKGCPQPVKKCKRPGYILPPPGVSYFADSVCISAVSGCPGNLILKLFARRAVCARPDSGAVVCPKGHLFDGVDRCVRCEPGARLITNPRGARKFSCEYCPGNSVAPGGLATKCIPCPCGYAKTADLSSCFNTIPDGVDFSCD